VAAVLTELHAALKAATVPFEIVAVQNGSRDRTAQILSELRERMPELRVVTVEVNQGFGYGLVQGLAAGTGEVLGFIPGDGQIAPRMVLDLLQEMERCQADVGQGWRITREDGWQRRYVSRVYNLIARALLGLPSRDLNGHPKLMSRRSYAAMELRSKDGFLDAEILLKANRLGAKVAHIDVRFHKRQGGRSKVRPVECWHFLWNLLRARFDRHDIWGLNTLPNGSMAAPPVLTKGTGAGS
jgi:glycosyltransferase involved in cell wall biosynthesis